MKIYLLFLIFTVPSYAEKDDYGENVKRTKLQLAQEYEDVGNFKEALIFYIHIAMQYQEFTEPAIKILEQRIIPSLDNKEIFYEIGVKRAHAGRNKEAIFYFSYAYEFKISKYYPKDILNLASQVNPSFLYELGVLKQEQGKKEVALFLLGLAGHLGEDRAELFVKKHSKEVSSEFRSAGWILEDLDSKEALKAFLISATPGYEKNAINSIKAAINKGVLDEKEVEPHLEELKKRAKKASAEAQKTSSPKKEPPKSFLETVRHVIRNPISIGTKDCGEEFKD